MYLSIYPSIFLSLSLSLSLSLQDPPNRGGRRHQGASPFYKTAKGQLFLTSEFTVPVTIRFWLKHTSRAVPLSESWLRGRPGAPRPPSSPRSPRSPDPRRGMRWCRSCDRLGKAEINWFLNWNQLKQLQEIEEMEPWLLAHNLSHNLMKWKKIAHWGS